MVIGKGTPGARIDWIGYLVQQVNRLPAFGLITTILLVFFVRFRLDTNEEYYMAFAKQFLDPDWIANSRTFTEFASTRVLYQYIVGFFLQFFSFEVAGLLIKLMLTLLLAWPLTRLYRLLNFDNADIIFHLPLLYVFKGMVKKQAFFAGEWMFLGVEPKVFAYIFVLFALIYFLQDKFYQTVAFLALATYFHLLVGGWIAIYFFLYHLVFKKNIRETIVLGLGYGVLQAPFFWYLSSTISESVASSDLPIQTDYLFTYVIQPYHTALFASMGYFTHVHLDGILATMMFGIFCWVMFSKSDNPHNVRINLFNLLACLGILVSVVLAYFDKTGAFVKYFPFRIVALFTFLVYIQLILYTRKLLLPERMKYLHFGVLLLVLFTSLPKVGYDFAKDGKAYFSGSLYEKDSEVMAAFIRENTPEDAVFLTLFAESNPDDFRSFDVDRSMMRRMERELFAAYFFNPASASPARMYDWYQRLEVKQAALRDVGSLLKAKAKYRIDYIWTDQPVPAEMGAELLFQSGAQSLYSFSKAATGSAQ